MGFTDRDRAILDFERTWWTVGGSKETRIRSQLGISATRYYKAVNELVESPEALAYDPLLVRRLRKARAVRRRARFEGRSADGPPAP